MSHIPVVRGKSQHDRVATAILDAAATVLAERGDAASMAEVAAAAGVGRSTLWRYFANREQLLEALTQAAVAELADRVAEANLSAATVADGLARITRAVLGAASKYRVLVRVGRKPEMPDDVAARLETPLLDLLRRGIADGTLRADVGVEALLAAYTGLLEGMLARGLHDQVGTEQATSVLVSIFLRGAAGAQPG